MCYFSNKIEQNGIFGWKTIVQRDQKQEIVLNVWQKNSDNAIGKMNINVSVASEAGNADNHIGVNSQSS